MRTCSNRFLSFPSQVWVALRKLKSIGLVHRDLKPRNVAISNKDPCNFRVKIIDFGNAVFERDLPNKGESTTSLK